VGVVGVDGVAVGAERLGGALVKPGEHGQRSWVVAVGGAIKGNEVDDAGLCVVAQVELFVEGGDLAVVDEEEEVAAQERAPGELDLGLQGVGALHAAAGGAVEEGLDGAGAGCGGGGGEDLLAQELARGGAAGLRGLPAAAGRVVKQGEGVVHGVPCCVCCGSDRAGSRGRG
jgi:hypothetical protein